MAPGRAIPRLSLLVLAGCFIADPETPSTRFEVASVNPEDGALDVVEAQYPEIRLTLEADDYRCDDGTFQLAAIEEDASVIFDVDIDVVFYDNGRRVQLQHEEALLSESWYGLTIQTGLTMCESTDGQDLRPFSSRFYVP